MPVVREVLDRKGRDVVSMLPSATVREAAQLMNVKGIGSVVVIEGSRVTGIFTERDVLRRVVAAGLDPAATIVRDVMTADLVTCTAEMSLDDCAALITSRRVRHLPVVGARGLEGLITSGDLLAYQMDEQQATIRQLNSYVYDVR